MFTWILDFIRTLLFKPRVYESKKITLDPCWKHMVFKKGCPTCRSLNAE
jgi:hypothetical protein